VTAKIKYIGGIAMGAKRPVDEVGAIQARLKV
jgi:glucuronosyltransferase